jgi:hypothetical protein
MKKAVLILGLLVGSAALFTNLSAKSIHPVVASWGAAAFSWAQTIFDFGTIKQNVAATHTFTFVNNGDAPLVISSVQASCGCTVTAYSKDPIDPGSEGFVKATYNAKNLGVFNKTVTVNANTENNVQLTIKGTVIE